MNPLKDRSSKTCAKLLLLFLWVAAALLASPQLFFFEYTVVYDEVSGVKPFCTLKALIQDPER